MMAPVNKLLTIEQPIIHGDLKKRAQLTKAVSVVSAGGFYFTSIPTADAGP